MILRVHLLQLRDRKGVREKRQDHNMGVSLGEAALAL